MSKNRELARDFSSHEERKARASEPNPAHLELALVFLLIGDCVETRLLSFLLLQPKKSGFLSLVIMD